MNRKKFLLFLLYIPYSLYSQDISIKSGQWKLVGFSYDITLNNLNLKRGDTIWTYNKDNKWYCYVKDYDVSDKCNEIENIDAFNGFWIYSNYSYNLNYSGNIATKDEPKIKKGWNLLSFKNAINDVDRYFNNSYTISVWGYKDGKWMLYTPNHLKFDTVLNLTKVDKNQAVWVDAKEDWKYIWIGKDRAVLDNGYFNTITKKSSDNVENIWNISFKIDNKNLDSFNIGVKILKESSGATGDIVFSGLSIKNGVINSPKTINIYGIKSNKDEGGTYFDSEYNPNNILSKSISLNGDILTIKLGTIMKKQNIVSINSFKAISRYKIQIDSDKLNIIGAKRFFSNESIHYTTDDSFNKKSEIKGDIEISK